MKLAIADAQSAALARLCADAERVMSSEVSEVEVVRAARRAGADRGEAQARQVLKEVSLVELTREIRMTASQLQPLTMTSIHAIHLATALELAIEGVVFVGYDRPLQDAARSAGFEIQSPGA